LYFNLLQPITLAININMLRRNVPTLVREKRQCAALPNSTANQILPAQKKAKILHDRETNEKALKTLNDLINENNGVRGPHFVNDVASTYNIKRNALYYRFNLQEKRKAAAGITPSTIRNGSPTTITPNTSTRTTYTEMSGTPNTIVTITPTSSATPAATTGTTAKRSGMQKIMNENIQKKLISEATFLAAQQFSDARKNAAGRVANGTMKKIIEATEKEKNLEPGTVNPECVKSRIRRNNITGFNWGATAPLHLIEPFLAELCIRASRMGASLTKKSVMQLCSELIKNTEHAENYAKFIGKTLDKEQATITPGNRWYSNFMKRYSIKLKPTASSNMDANCETYCEKENLKRMFDNIYEEMTKAGVAAIKLHEGIMLHKNGIQVYSELQDY
jgi:hypothetical protein